MSLRCMPLVVINLGGELVYILHRRLAFPQQADAAGAADPAHVASALRSVARAVADPAFLEQLWRPQEVYGWVPTVAVFERVCSAAGVAIDERSFGKLFDMMAVAFKRQIVHATCPTYLLACTVNHLRGVKALVAKETLDGGGGGDEAAADDVVARLDDAERRVLDSYGNLTRGEWLFIRQTLLAFLQNRRTKVSALVGLGWQGDDGFITVDPSGPVPRGSHAPGVITEYAAAGGTQTKFFNYGHAVEDAPRDAFRDARGAGVVELGRNAYTADAGAGVVSRTQRQPAAAATTAAATTAAGTPGSPVLPTARTVAAPVWDTVDHPSLPPSSPPSYAPATATGSRDGSASASPPPPATSPANASQGLRLLSALLGVRHASDDDGFRLTLIDDAAEEGAPRPSHAAGAAGAAAAATSTAAAAAARPLAGPSRVLSPTAGRHAAHLAEITAEFAESGDGAPAGDAESLLDLLDAV